MQIYKKLNGIKMSQIGEHKCVMCGSIKKECAECGCLFHTSRKNHFYCSDRCRTRKSRKKKAPE